MVKCLYHALKRSNDEHPHEIAKQAKKHTEYTILQMWVTHYRNCWIYQKKNNFGARSLVCFCFPLIRVQVLSMWSDMIWRSPAILYAQERSIHSVVASARIHFSNVFVVPVNGPSEYQEKIVTLHAQVMSVWRYFKVSGFWVVDDNSTNCKILLCQIWEETILLDWYPIHLSFYQKRSLLQG